MGNVFKVVLGLLICSFVSCASTYGRFTDSMNLTAGPDESEIIITRPRGSGGGGWAVKQTIFIDGQPQLKLDRNSSGKIIVKNGTHTIYAEQVVATSKHVEFTAESNRIRFLISQVYEPASSTLILVIEKESEFAL